MITVRKAVPDDRAQVFLVESKSTPNLIYLPHVFDQFVADDAGEFSVAVLDGKVVACGKFTMMPDHSAWLETIRVLPECQGLGIGKAFYARFFEVASQRNVSTMRMYTGVNNQVSKGLAEHFGFLPEETFRGLWNIGLLHLTEDFRPAFQPITDGGRAADLLLPHAEAWNGFVVMNRTFYRLTPSLCRQLAMAGQVYAEEASGSVLVVGARFMPEQALHIGLFAGDAERCLSFAGRRQAASGAAQLSCLSPTSASSIHATLLAHHFQAEASDFVVMKFEGDSRF